LGAAGGFGLLRLVVRPRLASPDGAGGGWRVCGSRLLTAARLRGQSSVGRATALARRVLRS
jgi:hypothetical protein